jgi:hypothetical protein
MPSDQSLYYALRAKKFADLNPILTEISECVFEVALRERDAEFAFKFSSLNKHTRELLFRLLRSLKSPSLGDSLPWRLHAPAHSNLREKIAWQFARCHMCGDCATERSLVRLLREARMATILTCRDCCSMLHHSERITHRALPLKGDTLVLVGVVNMMTDDIAGDAVLKRVAASIAAARTTVIKVARQKWTRDVGDAYTATRLARRSEPFPTRNAQDADNCRRHTAPLIMRRGSIRIIRVVEVAIILSIPGSSATQLYHLCIPVATAAKLIDAPTSRHVLECMLSTACNLRQRKTLLQFLANAPSPSEETRSRKAAFPVRKPDVCCTHGYGLTRSPLSLLSCSRCGQCDA